MPRIPQPVDLNATSVGILNAIRNGASKDYYAGVPLADQTTESLKMVGQAIMGFQPRANEFIDSLVNRIGLVMITSKLYDNPWNFFKKGLLEFGETTEEIFVNIARPFQFNPQVAETEWMRREFPDVRTAFHSMNYQKYYKVTISNDQLRQAFLSWNGITDLISRIIDTLYTSANYDEFLMMKYTIARMALDGKIAVTTIPAPDASTSRGIVSKMKAISNDFTFMKNKYNMAGVMNYSNKDDQYFIKTAQFDALVDVEVLALSFNEDRARFAGRNVLVDSFSDVDLNRLAELLKDDPDYVPFTNDEMQLLSNIQAINLDRNWFMIFDNFYGFTEQYNYQGLYWNYAYHSWKTFSVSPFANAMMFATGTNTVTSVTVSPATATVNRGATLALSATVEGTGFVNKTVTWTVTGGTSANTVISPAGKLYVGADETATTLTVTATSVGDITKSGNATITVANPTKASIKC